MIDKNELLYSLRENVLPRLLDGAIQGVFACVLIYLVQSFIPDGKGFRWEITVWWLCFMLIWGGQHYIFQLMLRRRAQSAESRYERLPNGMYTALTRVMTPRWRDALLQAALLIWLMYQYFDARTIPVPEHMFNYAWALALVPLWLLQNRFLTNVLVERGRNAFYEVMYEALDKKTQS